MPLDWQRPMQVIAHNLPLRPKTKKPVAFTTGLVSYQLLNPARTGFSA